MSSHSYFAISPQEAHKLVTTNQTKTGDSDNRQGCCYLLQVSFQPVYSAAAADLTSSCYKWLPRLVNGIPLGAGRMTADHISKIRWRYVEGAWKVHSFLSGPMSRDEAEETRRSLKDQLIKQSRTVFGDVTVKATMILSSCLSYDDGFYINDIAELSHDGLCFRD